MDNQNQNSQREPFNEDRRIQRKVVESRVKAIGQILQNLRKNSEQFVKYQTHILKVKRKKTEIQQKKAYYKDVYQDVMKPGDAVLRIFSSSKPLNTGDVFIDVKQKAKLLFSERAYTKMPNIVSGVYKRGVQTESKEQKQSWISRKFSDYDRIVTQQTGPLRIMLKKRSENHQGIHNKKPIVASKIKNINQLFSVYQSSVNDFYSDIKKACSTNAFTIKSKTQPSLDGSLSNSGINKKLKNLGNTMNRQGRSQRIYTDFG